MNKFLSFLISLSVLVILTCPGAANDTKADQATKLLAEALQQADIWASGPLQVEAKFNVPRTNQPDVSLAAKVYWNGPDKWRVEWVGTGYEETRVLSGGRLYTHRNTGLPAIQAMMLTNTLAIALGNDPAAAFFSPVPAQGVKFELSREKIAGVPVECIHPENNHGTACVDPAKRQIVQYRDNNVISDFKEYQTFESVSYPRRIIVTMQHGKVLAEGQLIVTRAAAASDFLFQPLATAEVSNYETCSNVRNSITAPKLDNHVMPRYPEEARRNYQQGTVWMYTAVGEDGSIRTAEVLSGVSPQLDIAAVTAVRQWKYTPYLRCGAAAAFETLITVNYTLSR